MSTPDAVTRNIHYSSARDDWPTPRELFETLKAEFHFTLDAAASHTNTKVPSNYYTNEDNGLVQPWTGTVWCNPPYGRGIGKWIEKAIQSANEGATVALLVPARTDSVWFQQLLRQNPEVRFLAGRVTFEGASDPAPFPSAVVVLRPSANWASSDHRATYVMPKRHDPSRPWQVMRQSM